MATVRVNPGDNVQAACLNLQSGDTLEVAGHHVNQHIGIRKGVDHITIIGVNGPNGEPAWMEARSLGLTAKGKPMLPPDFDYTPEWNSSWSGRGICVIKGNDCTVRAIRFSGARSNNFNGAGIRHEGTDLFVYDSEFDDNENGILGSEKDDPATPDVYEGGVVWVEHSHFHNNGYGSGQAHNIYIGRANLYVFFNNVSDSSIVGHLCKGRGAITVIFRNVFKDGTGNPSYHVDVEGYEIYVVENSFEKTPAAANPGTVIHHYLWHYADKPNLLRVLRNRIVNLETHKSGFVWVDNRIETKVNGKTVYDGVGVINGLIRDNVAVYADVPNLNLSADANPWKVPATVAVADNIVARQGQEPPAVALSPLRITLKSLPYFINAWKGASLA